MIKKDVLVSVVQQSDSAIYMHTYLFIFKFFSQLGCYIILSRVPCAYLRNLKKKGKNEFICKTEKDSQTQRANPVLSLGSRVGGTVREFGIDVYTLLYLKWITSRDLL